MPISKEMATRYPADWARRRRFIIQYRAQNRCEWCGAQNNEPHPKTGSMVVLNLAHVWEKTPESASLLNLACLCQRCHNRWDAADRRLSRIRRRMARLLQAGQLPLPWPPGASMAMEIYQLLIDTGQITPPVFQFAIPRGLRVRGVNHDQENVMTDPHEITAAITNLERELRDLGWRPVEMIDEKTGIPFTRWFPPVSRHVPLSNRHRVRGCGMEGCLLSMYVSRNHLPFWMCSCGQCHNTTDLQGWCVRRNPDKPYPYDRIGYPYTSPEATPNDSH